LRRGVPVTWLQEFDPDDERNFGSEWARGSLGWRQPGSNEWVAYHGNPKRDDIEPFDSGDPPRYESEAAYLKRHGLLLAGEARRLQPRDYEPVLVDARSIDIDPVDSVQCWLAMHRAR
jgi:hypothetical protein